MANTDYQETTPTVFSSVSLNGTGTLSALTVTASSQSLTGGIQASVLTAKGSAGFIFANHFISSVTTNQSGATSKVSVQGQLYFSVLSLTTNGAEFGIRSGNTVYRWPSSLVG